MTNNLDSITVDNVVVEALIDRAFDEDVQSGDVTTNAIVDKTQQARAVWVAKEQGIVAGLDVAKQVFEYLDPLVVWEPNVEDGTIVDEGTEIVTLKGRARALLTAERIALNIAQRMSGIATMTQKFVDAVDEYSVEILDTRKTVPGFRQLDKYAVQAGGGTNHRMGLYDMAMVKDNHIVAAGNITEAVQKIRNSSPEIQVEVETVTLDQVREALAAGADVIMLDNMSIEQMNKAVEIIGSRAHTEASGNVTLDTVKEIAATGVDYISIGALTHSVKAFDISQRLTYINNH
ncbi:carboxylating nicotinate-nucleotide diphosphorylase [Fodinibius sp. Rm-B-1B1-1]|uniref:carboxylating nicotinate-nucleotide diphosphorylase n=1 Tax=Fodinibius alkaliphilus TaxID=3140241 RepID=UPI003159EE65